MQKSPLFSMTAIATGVVNAARFIGMMTGAHCASGAKAQGVSQYAAAIGEAFALDRLGTSIVEAGGAINVGDEVKAAADGSGRAIARGGTGPLDGYAVTPATAAGQKIEILLSTAGKGGPLILGDVTLDAPELEADASGTIHILGASANAALSVVAGVLPGGWILDSAARTIAGEMGYEGQTFNFTLRQVDAAAANSPHDTPLSITWAEVVGGGGTDPTVYTPAITAIGLPVQPTRTAPSL